MDANDYLTVLKEMPMESLSVEQIEFQKSSTHEHLGESFQRYFEMVPANTEALKEHVYRLRYQIYCLETGFLPSAQYPGGLERDAYDDSAEHYLIRHRQTGTYAATTRLILPDRDRPQRSFPTESLSPHIDFPQRFDNRFRLQLGEASRFCVSKHFKRRLGELGTTTGAEIVGRHGYTATEDERRVFPHITIALLACLVRMSAHRGITHWYAFMEAPLIRLFRLLGIQWIAIGPTTNFHGTRQPCIIEVAQFLEHVKNRNRQIWDMLTDYGRFWQQDEHLSEWAERRFRATGGAVDRESEPMKMVV